MLESQFQAKLIKELKKLFPGCIVMKSDSGYLQGIPDLLILFNDKWAALECKQHAGAKKQPSKNRRTMNILNNRNKRTSIFKAVALCLIAAMSFTLVSCDDDMDIQQSYPFTVEVMPVPNKVVKGQTVEIRCELKKEGDFSGTLYTIRYFQFEGEGSLKMDNGITFLPNDRYLLENEKFRLYYTAAGDEAHNFIVVVEDNFSNSYELEFDFNNRNVKDDDLTIVPIGNFSPLLK